MAAAISDRELHSFFRGETRDELRTLRLGAPELEVWRTRAAQRRAPEERATQIRAAAACACDNASRRRRKRRQACTQDAGLVQDLQRVLVTGDVELVARSTVEGAPLVGADLRRDAERTQEAEGAARDRRVGDVEMDRDLTAAAQVNAAGGVKQAGELGEPVALVAWRDRRELVAELLRE
jgi:hypothetical protein